MRSMWFTGVLVLASWACSGGDDDGEPGGVADAAGECDLSGLDPATETAERDDELEVLFYTATSGELRLTVDFYFSLGASDSAQTFELRGEGLDTCDTCVFAHSGCGELVCDRAFVGVSGLLEVTSMGAVGERFTGSLAQTVFAEAVIDAGTQETTIVEGGQTWCIDDLAFDLEVVAP